MAKSKKMNSSLKSSGEAWRNHVANVAKTEGVKYGKAMSLASKGKYGAEWKKIKASLGSGKKAASASVGCMAMASLNPADINQSGGEVVGAEEFEKSAPATVGGRRRRTRKAKRGSRRNKRGGILLV